MSQNPVTGQLVPAPLISALVPGVGDPFSGIVYSTDAGYSSGFIAQRGEQVAPPIRAGMALPYRNRPHAKNLCALD